MSALTVYLTNTNDSLLPNARQLTNSAPGAETSVATVQLETGWAEPGSQGGGVSGQGAEYPFSDDHGFIWDVTTLEGQTLAAGNYTPTVKLGVNAGQITADIHVRIGKRTSGGVYSLICESVLTAQLISLVGAVYALPATAGAAMAFAVGDKLCVDLALNIANFTGSGSVTWFQNGGANEAIVTPGYGATVLTAPQRRRHNATPDAPPQAALRGHRRRGRVPNIGLALPPVTPSRRRTAHAAPRVPPASGARRRRRVPGIGVPVRLARHRATRSGPPPTRGHTRRGRLYPTSYMRPIGMRRPPLRRAEALPPTIGRRRRGRVPGSGLSAANNLVHGHRKTRPAALPPQTGRRRRGRVPGSGLAALQVLGRHRAARAAPRVPPPSGRRRRARVPATGGAAAPRHRIQRQRASLPPQTWRRRRGRVPGSGQAAGTFAWTRHRVARRGASPWPRLPTRRRGQRGQELAPSAARPARRRQHGNPVPVPLGRHRRGRLPGIGSATYVLRRHGGTRRPAAAPPGTGRRRRQRVPGSGLAAAPIAARHRTARRAASQPPAAGRRTRRRVPGTGLNPLPVSRRHLARRAPPVPPTAGRRRRGKVAGPTAARALARRRNAIARQAVRPFTGGRRRGRVPNQGLSGLAAVMRRRRVRLTWWPLYLSPVARGRAHGRNGLPPAIGSGTPVAGPYRTAAGVLWSAGAVAGTVEVM